MSDTADDDIKTAIGDILKEADPVSQLIIGAYKHSVPHSTNVKLISGSRFKSEQLESCARFLGLDTRDDQDALIFTNKSTLADRIITKIEATFPSTCQDCEEEYRVKFRDQHTAPRLLCFLCLQPSHNCDKVTSFIESMDQILEKPIGNAWICSGCWKKNNPLLSNKPRKRSDSVVSTNGTPISSPAPSRPGQENSPAITSPAINRILAEEMGDGSPTPSNLTLDTVRRASESDANVQPQAICQRYANNKCPHGLNGNKVVNGMTCPDGHPKRCLRYCRFGTKRQSGCQKGDNCKFFHPKLCRNSTKSLSCYNENCTFVHLKFTKRQRDTNEQDHTQIRQRQHDGESRERNPRPIINNQSGWNKQDNRPNSQRVRYDSTASHQSRPITPSLGGYTNNSSDISFLVRMIQNMKSDFQKDLALLRDSISLQPQPTRWNHQTIPAPSMAPQQPAPLTFQDNQIPSYQHPQANLSNPLWAQTIPQFCS